VGEIWVSLKDRYPKTQDQPPLFNPFVPQAVPFQLAMQSAGLFRVWLVSADDTEILQIQGDRVLRNWRRRDGREYPRFEPLLEKFVEEFTMVDGLVGPFDVQQIEVTYINWISDLTLGDFFIPASVGGLRDPRVTPVRDVFQWSSRYSVSSDDGEEVGSLSLSCNSARRPTSDPPAEGLMLTLSFTSGIQDRTKIPELMSLGRDTIVRAFTDITTEPAQIAWGRIK
jgi:uncharacterized protein (TIGR04255 family)